jgi:cysteinyl-tRNA synthetase
LAERKNILRHDNKTAPWLTNLYLSYLTLAKTNGMKILVVDYCANASRALDSYAKNSRFGFISYAASSKFDQSPALMKTSYSSNSKNISKLSDAKNFFLIINA